MPTKIRKLKITRVAACRQGANYDELTREGAHILLFKSQDVAKNEDECTCGEEKDADCPVHGTEMAKQDMTVGDVYSDTFATAGTAHCTDPTCDDPDCPVHGALVRARRRKKKRAGALIKAIGMSHAEPDGDEAPPRDYATRSQQRELWGSLWDKWHQFSDTLYDIIADADEDNIPHLPILVDSIGQFQEDVADLLAECGVLAKAQPLLTDLLTVGKAGAAMAGHRRKRLQDAITALQQLLEECTPDDLPHGVNPPIDRAGLSAADVTGFPAIAKTGDAPMAETLEEVKKRAEATEAQLATVTKRAESAEARVQELEPLAQKVATLETTLAKMRQTPDEQEAEYWASVPEPVRKKHEADEAEKVELRKQLDEARQEREQTVYISKTADFRGFGMVQKHWRILKAIDAIPDVEDRDELLRLMKSSAERDASADLYRASGSSGRYSSSNGQLESASAEDQLMALTQAYMEEKGVDFQKAADVIAKSHRELYDRATEERRSATRTTNGR